MKKSAHRNPPSRKLRLSRETLRWLTLREIRGGDCGTAEAALAGIVTHTCCPCDSQATCVEMTCEMC